LKLGDIVTASKSNKISNISSYLIKTTDTLQITSVPIIISYQTLMMGTQMFPETLTSAEM
jgi:hypothetical protein